MEVELSRKTKHEETTTEDLNSVKRVKYSGMEEIDTVNVEEAYSDIPSFFEKYIRKHDNIKHIAMIDNQDGMHD